MVHVNLVWVYGFCRKCWTRKAVQIDVQNKTRAYIETEMGLLARCCTRPDYRMVPPPKSK